jgi:hypothetical protein
MVLYVLSQLTFFIMILVFPQIKDVFMQQLAGITLFFVTGYGGVIIYLTIYFSGTPYKNATQALIMKRMLKIFFLWTVCQIPKPILWLAKINVIPNPGEVVDSSQDIKEAAGVFVLQIMTEGLPFLLSLEGNFMQIFTSGFKVDDQIDEDTMREGLH